MTTSRSVFAAALVLLFTAACSDSETPPPGGNDGGIEQFTPVEVSASGTVSVHPAAVAWYQATSGTAPSIVGLTVRVEEPLKVALGQEEEAVFGQKVLDESGTFTVEGIRSDDVSLGIAGGVRDEMNPSSPRVIRSATTMYDVVFEGGQPTDDIVNAKVYAFPTAFHDALTTAVGPAAIQAIAGSANDELLLAGFILGRIIDAAGNPVAGRKVTFPNEPSLSSQVYYPSVDLTSAPQTQTSANGLFIYVHNGDTLPKTFVFSVDGSEYLDRKGGAVNGAALVLDVFPGNQAP